LTQGAHASAHIRFEHFPIRVLGGICLAAAAKESRRDSLEHLWSEEATQGLGQAPGIAGEERVSGQAAAVENGVGEVTDKLPRVLLLKPQGKIHSALDGDSVCDFDQHDIVALLSPKFFNVVVAAGEIDLKTSTDERPVDRGLRVFRVAA
jgi:hypothetical protein